MTTTLGPATQPGDPTQERDVVAPRERLRLVAVLGLLVALGPFTIDLYLPALPTITDDLDTTESAVQLTLTGTMFGLAVGQLVLGPLSDALGRRRPLLAGMALHVLASVLCVVAPNAAVLGVLRVAQGLGAAAATVIALAVVRDLFSGLAAATMFSRLMLVLGTSPVLAPTIGGELLRWTEWRGVFVALAGLGFALIVLAGLALPETLPPERRRRGGVRDTAAAYRGLLRDRPYVGLVLVVGLSMASLLAYVAGSSFVLQDEFGLSEQEFGLAFAVNAVAVIGATQLNVRLLRRWGPQQLLVFALLLGTGAGLVMLALAVAGVGGLLGVLVPLFVALAGFGLAGPNAQALALMRHGEAAGTAAALLGAAQFGIGSLASPLVGALGNDAAAMAALVAGGMVAALLVLATVVRPWQLGGFEAAERAGR
ncbi:multidrug effflux MFS transporter [Motilibacter deserti]|uniref:Multidrug effflux MFS transporter n=1 Tax=Motilibacter deserti TaxID=2714956 RepID=A0ABX0GWT1_9ACTN|nr:multidrug effflux MFS transporter [Motilibacter deserti]NHC13713.1 multidrug effflux MFS transporter [Motilibacter deserti]